MDGSGNAFVGASQGTLYEVNPNGKVQYIGLIDSPQIQDEFIYSVALDGGNVYLGSLGNIYFGNPNGLIPLLFNANASGLALDPSGTLITGQYLAPQDLPTCPDPAIPGGCGGPIPHVDQLSFNNPKEDADGNLYGTIPNGPASSPYSTDALFKLNRTQPSGVVFASSSAQSGTGSVGITNSGNAPLTLSQLQPTLSGASAESFAIEKNTCGQTLAPAATCTLTLSFTPAGPSPSLPANGSLLLNGLPGGQRVVALQGFPNQ